MVITKFIMAKGDGELKEIITCYRMYPADVLD